MRILHILDHSIPLQSGYAFRTAAILRTQRSFGWETFHVTSAKHYGATADEEQVEGLSFIRTAPWGGPIARLPVAEQISVVAGLRHRLVDGVIERVRPDLLHAHSPSLNGLAALSASRRYDLPMVYEVRALWEDGAVDQGVAKSGGPRYRATRALETFVMRRADAVTTICEGLRRDIVGRGIDEARVTVVPNAVDISSFSITGERDVVLAASLGVAGARVVGFIGSFYAYEGLRLLIESLPLMLARDPSVRLVLVGGGQEEELLRRRTAELGLGNEVVFAGRVPHELVRSYYNLMDVMVYPRLPVRVTELVTPLKPLEAMAQGRLVVASDVGGHRELIRHETTGLLFRAGSAESLAATVTDALSMPDSAQIRKRARQFVENERTWSQSVRNYEPIYTSVTSRRNAKIAALARRGEE